MIHIGRINLPTLLSPLSRSSLPKLDLNSWFKSSPLYTWIFLCFSIDEKMDDVFCFFLANLFFSLCKQNMEHGLGGKMCFLGPPTLCVSNFFNSNFTVFFLFFFAMQPSEAWFLDFLRGFENLGYLWYIVPWKRPKTKEKKHWSQSDPWDWYNSYDNVKACFNSSWNTHFLG